MNHPKREEWIHYLYGEVNPETQRELKAHLNGCPECRAEFTGWEHSASRLDAWKLPRARRQGFWVVPIFKWAAATALLTLGFIAGHLIAPKPAMANLPPAILTQMRQELRPIVREEMDKAAATALAQAGQQSAKAIAACEAALEAKRSQDYQDVHAALLVLKEQLDTVAMNTDASFRQAEQKLVQLADFKQPRNPSNQP